MKIKLERGKPALAADIETLERGIASSLPQTYLGFVLENDGAEPETNIFKISDSNACGVNRFIPVREILAERANIENLPAFAFPVAWCEGGNYVFLDSPSGAVYFWDHEQPVPPVRLAGNFLEFLRALEPFDPASIKLKPGQVVSAWIDPNFFKSIKK